MEKDIFIYCIGFGIITFFTQMFVLIIFPMFFKKFYKEENWTVGKNIINLILIISLISAFNWLYHNNFMKTYEDPYFLSFFKMISYTFILSLFPIFISTFLIEKKDRKERLKTTKELMKFQVPKKEIKKIEEIILYGTNKTENISFNLNHLIYISSQGNYASFFIKTGTEIKELILRNTLSAIIKDLNKYNNIIRCHKSYIINTNYVDAIEGNARGYSLRSNNITQQIPVSRKYSKEDLITLIH